jgi:two-component system NarL family sensor kinase
MKRVLPVLVVLLTVGALARAQVPTSNVVYRVLLLKTATGTGSAFTIEVDGKQEEARRSVLDLRAAPLEGRTLPAALASLAAESNDGGSPSVAFEAVPAVPPSLPPAIEVGFYRIAQEALQNALRHAAASRVMLRLEVADATVRLTVEDDGRGFAIGDLGDKTADGPAASRFGLVGMRERARLLGCSFQVESSPGAGTRITAEAPLSRPPIQ